MPRSIEEIESMAETLGEAIADTTEFKALVVVNTKVRADVGLRGLHEQYLKQQEKIEALLQDQKPVEPADKREMERLQNQLRSNTTMQEMARAEADYSHLMSRVSRGINMHLEELLSGGENDHG
jgi:cell fate (sporulation/competence/biofilm development) regulator YlbF (YheA/YmcA/DUF963 family)